MSFIDQVLLVVLMTVALAYAATSSPAADRTIETEAAELMAPWNNTTDPGVGVAVMVDGEIAFRKGAGLAELEHTIPIVEDTVFHAASLSKQFTAFLVLSLVDEGKLLLDDKITRYLPELENTGHNITIRQLLDHIGGLREQSSLRAMAGWSRKDLVTQAQMLALLSLQKGRNFEPGTRFEYSNTGYGLLSVIVSRVSGEPFSKFAAARIFTPLGMTNTQFRDDLSRIIPNSASSYAPGREGFSRYILDFELLGSTGLQTTTGDLLKWARNFETRDIGAPRVFELMAQRTFAANGEPVLHGRGQELRRWHGFDTWSHGGRDAGFRAFLLRIPNQRVSVAVLSNRADFDMAKMAFDMADVFLKGKPGYRPEPVEDWSPATENDLKALAGDYELFPGLIFTLSTEGRQLLFSPLNAGSAAPLPQIGENRFLLNPAANISLEFVTDKSGRANAFNYVISLNGKLKAPRVTLAPFDPSGVDLQAYSGIYESEELQAKYEFRIENGALVAKHLRLQPIHLTPYQEDTFAGSVPDFGRVEFNRNAAGEILGCTVSGALAEGVVFRKLK